MFFFFPFRPSILILAKEKEKITSRFIKTNYKLPNYFLNDRYDVEVVAQLLSCRVFANFILVLQIHFDITNKTASHVIHLPINLICFWGGKNFIRKRLFCTFLLLLFRSIFIENFGTFIGGSVCVCGCARDRVTLIEDERM